MPKTLSSHAQNTLKSKFEKSPNNFQVKARSKPSQNQRLEPNSTTSQRSRPKSTPKSNVKRLSSQDLVKIRGDFHINAWPKLDRLPS